MEQLILPALGLPPTTNNAYVSVPFLRSGAPFILRGMPDVMKWCSSRRVLSKQATEYKAAVSQVLNEGYWTSRIREFVELHGTVDLYYYVTRPNWYTMKGAPNRNAGDSDGRVKILKDIVFDTIGIDDACVFYDGVRKVTGPQDGVVLVLRPTPDILDEFSDEEYIDA